MFSATGRWNPARAGCVVAVGNFDGVHVGHAAIARRLVARAEATGVASVAVTFHPHPSAILRPDAAPPALTTPRRRAELLAQLGVDAVVVQPADRALLAEAPETFFTEMLVGRLGALGIVEGADFRFGAGRRGDVELLGALCAAAGIPLDVVPPVIDGAGAVSSSRLRRLLSAGDIASANRLLTACYRISGRVVEGAKRGRTLGFPTANLSAIATLLPAGGVYAARVTVADDAHAGSVWPAAVHVGPSVTFGATEPTVEAHLLGFRGDLYGTVVHVDFVERLRDTRGFSSVDDLVAQLTADAARAAVSVGADPTAVAPGCLTPTEGP